MSGTILVLSIWAGVAEIYPPSVGLGWLLGLV